MTSLLLALLLGADPCERCHEDEAAAFAASRHAVARTLPVFTRSLAHSKPAWCLSCHRPLEGRVAVLAKLRKFADLTKLGRVGDAPQEEQRGLTCQSCHGVRGELDAVRSTHATEAGRTSHPVVVEPAFETASCAPCHEFNAPLPGHLDPVVLSDQPLQSTVSEQQRALPQETCSKCHDPHRALGGHDRALLGQALQVKALALDGGVALELRTGRTGHRFPTGDPFRRVVLTTCADARCDRVVGRTILARNHGLNDAEVWAVLRDTTLASEERRVVVLPAAPYWSARYFFGDPRFEEGLPEDEISLPLGGGMVPP